MVGNQLRRTASGSLDHENADVWNLVLRATDSLGGTTDADYILSITDVNEAPTIEPTPSRTVAEDHEVGAAFDAAIASTDVDADQGRVYSIVGGDDTNNQFTIGATTGVLGVAKALDFETKATYSLTVRVTDTGVPALTADTTVTVTVTDANEAPSVTAGQERSLQENTAEGTALTGGNLEHTDPDGDSVTWSIIAGNEGAFAISAAGQLSVENSNVSQRRFGQCQPMTNL